MTKKPKKNNLAIDTKEHDLVPIDESPDSGRHQPPARREPSWEPKAMPTPEPERRETGERVLITKPFKARSFRRPRVSAPDRQPVSRSFYVLIVLGFLGGAWMTAFHSYLSPLSKPATARPQQTNGKGFPVYQVPGSGPRCLVELETTPSGTQVRVNRVWSGGLTPTVLSLPCKQSALLTLTTRDGLVTHETLKPTKPVETFKLKISKSAVSRALTWLRLVSDFHSLFFQKR